MKQILLYGGLPLLAMATLTGCIDDNYDLSDIDTTTEIKVKDLVLPINIDPITLGDIIEIKDDDQIKIVNINGQTFYAVQESGKFKSDDIYIPRFKTNDINVSPTHIHFNIPSPQEITSTAIDIPFSAAISQDELNKDFAYSANDIDKSILEISELYTDDFTISLDFEVNDEVTNAAQIAINNLHIDLPKGLQLVSQNENYDPATGRLSIESLSLNEGKGKANLSLTASMIDLKANEQGIEDRSLNFQTQVSVNDAAILSVRPTANASQALPNNVDLTIKYSIGRLNVTAVSGKINYQLEGININPVSLANIPDFLSEDKTNLILANPQIYLSVNNPVADDKLGYSTGLEIKAVRDNQPSQVFPLNNTVMVGFQEGVGGPYQFCLSPKDPDFYADDYKAPQHIVYSDLSNVISGNGIPKSLEISLIDPQIYEQHVHKFGLGRDLHKLEGEWKFLAPLAMKKDSEAKIIYAKTVDGWSDDDVKAITINTLEVTMNVTNDTPLVAHLEGYPIDPTGNQIKDIEIKGADIPGNVKDHPVTVHITGKVKNLDGITFTATVTPSSDDALSPNQSITLSNIKAKVSGNYTKEL